MDFKEYAVEVGKTAKYYNGLNYTIMALGGEAGELLNEYKKHLRDSFPNDMLDKDRRIRMLLELGDILWYLTRTAYELDSSLEHVAQMNIEKLATRYGMKEV